jgi:transcriptional regulator with XRE-family HTH domain
MTPKELTDFLRNELKATCMTQAEIMRRANLSQTSVHNFQYNKCATSLHTFLRIARAIGYDVKLVRNGTIETRAIEVRPTMKREYRISKPENEFACLKCGRDAGVVAVAGHLQCAHCHHIMEDCCGD